MAEEITVEALAKALYEYACSGTNCYGQTFRLPSWEELPDGHGDYHRAYARWLLARYEIRPRASAEGGVAVGEGRGPA